MAKVSAPLMSFRASGKLANALVYFPWKGIQSVRQYVIPANPKTPAQVTQRAKMTAAVAEWHSAAYNTIDRSAWRVFSGTLTKVMAGFNAMCRAHINESVAGGTWEAVALCVISAVGANGMTIEIDKTSAGNAPYVWYGISKLYMPTSEIMVDQTGDKWEATLSGLLASTGYFFYILVGAAGTDLGRTGIYYQRTTA